ncbi:MAG TPA: MmcQ/YjbR family DNA-binding protein [Bryobacteraceae bacterium]|jgi:predicted DNA-binding protein (MmcQ/YjbR family)
MIEWLRAYCLSFPHATETVQWGEHLVFKIAGKVFAITALEPDAPYLLTIKCAPEKFAECVERPGIVPAPYLARAKWIAVENEDAVSHAELKAMIRESYDLVCAKLPKKTREELARAAVSRAARPRPRR